MSSVFWLLATGAVFTLSETLCALPLDDGLLQAHFPTRPANPLLFHELQNDSYEESGEVEHLWVDTSVVTQLNTYIHWKQLKEITLKGDREHIQKFVAMQSVTEATHVNIYCDNLTEEAVSDVGKHAPDTEVLRLHALKLTSEGKTSHFFRPLASLERLEIWATTFCSAFLDELVTSTHIIALRLYSSSRIGDDFWNNLCNNSHLLKSIDVSVGDIAESDVVSLLLKEGLDFLSLPASALVKNVIRKEAVRSSIKSLVVNNTSIDVADVLRFQQLRAVEFIGGGN